MARYFKIHPRHSQNHDFIITSGACKHFAIVWTEWSKCTGGAGCGSRGIILRRRTLVDGVGSSCKRKEEVEREACYTPCQTIEELESVIREKEEDFVRCDSISGETS